MYEAFEGIPRCTRIVDDVLAYDPNMGSHEDHARQILTRCAEKGITLNEAKFEFGKTRIIFAGYEITKHGYSIAPKITQEQNGVARIHRIGQPNVEHVR